MSEEIVDQTFAPVADAIESEYASAKSAAENGVRAAKQKAQASLKM